MELTGIIDLRDGKRSGDRGRRIQQLSLGVVINIVEARASLNLTRHASVVTGVQCHDVIPGRDEQETSLFVQ